MGAIFGRIWAKLFGYTEMRILMLGMDAAGKSSILYRLKFGGREEIKTIPTLEFNVETLYCRHLQLIVWDIGGGEQQRKIWRFYSHGTNGLVFVVDSCDHQRIPLVREEVHKMTQEVSNCPVLFFANKQDLETAMSVSEITTQLDLEQLGLQSWLVQPSVATTGQGLREGFDWLARALGEAHRRKAGGHQAAALL